MKKKILIIVSLLILIAITIFGVLFMKKNKTVDEEKDKEITYVNNSFNLNLIKAVNREENYLISPYSIEIALNLLKAGADGNTLSEIEQVIGNRSINDVSIKNRVSVANAAFIKNKYKQYVLSDYYNILTNKYQSEILYDNFNSPKVINDWVNKKTNGMIKEILSNMDENFILGLANALAIDVEWLDSFECNATSSEVFNKVDKTKINVEMMHKTLQNGSHKYLSSEDAKGVIMPYKKYDLKTGKEVFSEGNSLEFVAILPNDSLDDYINNLTEEKMNKLLGTSREVSDNFEINLSLPRFKYDYDLGDFKDVLKNLGIKEVFDENNANLTKIIPRGNNVSNLYVGAAIHKTHIDLNEKGTKAAAITYFGVYDGMAMPEEKEKVDIVFDRPFMYMIRDSKTSEMLFFGTVYEPNTWNGSTCSEVDN